MTWRMSLVLWYSIVALKWRRVWKVIFENPRVVQLSGEVSPLFLFVFSQPFFTYPLLFSPDSHVNLQMFKVKHAEWDKQVFSGMSM